MADLEFKPDDTTTPQRPMPDTQTPPQPDLGAANTPLPGAPGQPPYSYGKYTQQVNASKGDYFSHDNKAYYRRDGKTFLLTGDAMGDVELDADQSVKLDKDMADKAAREKAEKEGPIVSDHIPGGTLDPKAPEPDTRQFIKGYSTAEDIRNQSELFYKGYTNEGKPSDEEMWRAPPAQKLGRIWDSRSLTPGGEGTSDLAKIGKKLSDGEQLNDAEKWQAMYHTGRMAADWLPIIGGTRLIKRFL